MKSVVSLMISLIMVTALFIGGLQLVSAMMAEPETHRFANLDAPDLWTLQPKTIDPAAQTYERLPAATPLVVEPVRQAKTDTDPNRDQPAMAQTDLDHSIETASIGNDPMEPEYIAAHLDWCHQRYRSYDSADNSYQPYGGSRRACVSPYSTSDIGVTDTMPTEGGLVQNVSMREEVTQQQAINDGSAMSQQHVAWCFSQYRSYRPEDNSYQPYAGPRQECLSPHG